MRRAEQNLEQQEMTGATGQHLAQGKVETELIKQLHAHTQRYNGIQTQQKPERNGQSIAAVLIWEGNTLC